MGATVVNDYHQNNGLAISNPDPRAVGENVETAAIAVKSGLVRFIMVTRQVLASAHQFPPAFVGGLSRSILPGADLTGRVLRPAQSLSFQSGHHFLHKLASGFPCHASSFSSGVAP